MTVGMDLGGATVGTSFDGTEFEEATVPRHLQKALKQQRRVQRALSRWKTGSGRRHAQARRVSVIHRKVRERREDLLHQASHQAIASADVLKVVTLNALGVWGATSILPLPWPTPGWPGWSRSAPTGRAGGREIGPWFPASQTRCVCDAGHREEAQPLGAQRRPVAAEMSWAMIATRPRTTTTGILRSRGTAAATTYRAW